MAERIYYVQVKVTLSPLFFNEEFKFASLEEAADFSKQASAKGHKIVGSRYEDLLSPDAALKALTHNIEIINGVAR